MTVDKKTFQCTETINQRKKRKISEVHVNVTQTVIFYINAKI